MKNNKALKLILITFFTFTYSSNAFSEILYSCKKKNAFINTSYLWTEIEKSETGEIIFRYGNGIDTQMLDVFFDTKVTELTPGIYQANDPNFTLDILVKNSLLSFQIKTDKKNYSKNKFKCGN